MAGEAVLLFDGVCTLCNAAVDFVVARDHARRFRFAPLESAAGVALLRAHGLAPSGDDPDTIILVEDGRAFERSTAALRVARRLGGAWPLVGILLAIPRPLRDAAYGWLARRRRRWFGRVERCPVPGPELAERFLEEPR